MTEGRTPPSVTPDRPFGYPLAMGLILRCVPDLRAIVVAQAVATLSAAAVLATLIWLAGARMFDRSLAHSQMRLLAVGFFLWFAFNEAIVQREWSLLAEGWVPVFLGVQAGLAWALMGRPRPLAASLALFALFCAAGAFAVFTKPNWGLAAAMLPLPWVFACFLSARSRTDFWCAVSRVPRCSCSFSARRLPSSGTAPPRRRCKVSTTARGRWHCTSTES